ncbi:hypothetical protein AKJ47_01255 [candidate division MSBL1 archaeon SCGC-AAA261G05]|uniref:Transglutaminase-like domain-containing protein n=1 Tax=candidate division MSBL1 archaeon SCGC-AAA261G05 TaxID=1698276 RepID=A0A133VC07_9EURY|nr:hypothetical protein AKJ47_01255 [candidate division MSBL1 archaeon SCGC-AAA261G05]
MRKLALASLVTLVLLSSVGSCIATSSNFYTRNGEKYDNWSLCRTRCWGEDGFFQVHNTTFRPAIAFESLGELKNTAWEVGEGLAERYSGNELAKQIFDYVRDHVIYTSDSIQFAYDEFARNADEVAEEIESNGSSRGDCEDYAVLLAVMFKAAGFRSAVVLAPEHAAAPVYLPGYPGANAFWDFRGEGGWIWAEATGRTNPLGWIPPELMRSDLLAYEIGEEPVLEGEGKSEKLATSGGGGQMFFGGSSFFSMLLFLWMLSLFKRRR